MLGNCCKSLQSESTHATIRWFHSVEKVVAEIDLERLLQRVYAAEEALFVRWSELSVSEPRDRAQGNGIRREQPICD